MKPTVLVVSLALAFGTLAGCDRNPNPTPSTTGATPCPSLAFATGQWATALPDSAIRRMSS